MGSEVHLEVYTLLCVNYSSATSGFVLGGETFDSWKLSKIKETKLLFQMNILFQLRHENKTWLVILGTSVDIIMFSDFPISLSTNQDFT